MSKYYNGIKIKHKSIFSQWYMQLIIWFALSGIFIALGFISLKNYAYSSVHIDANPSITLTLNKEGKVVGIFGRNADGKDALKVGRIKGQGIEEAMETLVTSMLDNGYLSQEQSAMLISVESKDEELADELQYMATDAADMALSEVLDNGVILDQLIEADASTRAMAEKYNITSGKAYLIQMIMNDSPEVSVSELAGSTMTELIATCISSGVDLSQYVDIIGDALEDYYGISGEEEEDFETEDEYDEDYDSDEIPDFMEGYDGQFNSEAEGFMGPEDEDDYEDEETNEDEDGYYDDDDATNSSTATVGSKRTSGGSLDLEDDDDYDEGLADDFEDDDDYYQSGEEGADDGYDDGDDGSDDGYDNGYDDGYDDGSDDGGEAEEEIISG